MQFTVRIRTLTSQHSIANIRMNLIVTTLITLAYFASCAYSTPLVNSPSPRALDEYCWSADPLRSQRELFGTRTAYQNVRPVLAESVSVPSE